MTDTKQETQVPTGIRLPESLIERADALARAMSRPGLTVTRADVLRLAAHKGIAELEVEEGVRK
jgi:predicted DNA-binding protein